MNDRETAPPVGPRPLVIVSPYSQSRRPSVSGTLPVRSAAVHAGLRNASMLAPWAAADGAGRVQPAASAGCGPATSTPAAAEDAGRDDAQTR